MFIGITAGVGSALLGLTLVACGLLCTSLYVCRSKYRATTANNRSQGHIMTLELNKCKEMPPDPVYDTVNSEYETINNARLEMMNNEAYIQKILI